MPSKIALGTLMEASISKRGFKGLFDVVIVVVPLLYGGSISHEN
tara:strand:- start:1229 stop:1360 length:132 start_codon:yes stop_codon:yes gene_type:complete